MHAAQGCNADDTASGAHTSFQNHQDPVMKLVEMQKLCGHVTESCDAGIATPETIQVFLAELPVSGWTIHGAPLPPWRWPPMLGQAVNIK